jgi:hypothetical protein
VSAQTEVEVQPGRLYTLFIEPNPVTVKANVVQAFEVKGFDVKENQVPISASGLNWGVLGGVGVFENAGMFRGTSMGRGKVTAGVDDLIAEAYVTVIPGEPDAGNSRVRITHPTLPADGSAFSEVILEVRDFHNNPVPGVKVTLVASRQGDKVVQPPETDARGQARGRISSAQAGTTTISAVVRGLTFVDTSEVKFE